MQYINDVDVHGLVCNTQSCSLYIAWYTHRTSVFSIRVSGEQMVVCLRRAAWRTNKNLSWCLSGLSLMWTSYQEKPGDKN